MERREHSNLFGINLSCGHWSPINQKEYDWGGRLKFGFEDA